ncbi:hypothetical protein [Lentiprolixibacter aurantiacus]|uniref:Uncharacterized protein n=1 Tax=Lentiprolixibacter aurantiacus TaxID=2993939 RepID=A0AAE3MJP5_9FLAO|nr:hypothetical protein [Lentiprolixibacter aurantiacus]MCX2718871.1 hypothetical protein [Lentiprolixibacter aurantiacus]
MRVSPPLIVFLFIIQTCYSQSTIKVNPGDTKHLGEHYVDNGINPPLAISGGTLFERDGIRFSFQLYNGPDASGQSEVTCDNAKPENNVQCFAKAKKIKYWRFKFQIENTNPDKKVVFKNLSTVGLNFENVDQPLVLGACNNVTGTYIKYLSGNYTLEPNSSLLIDDPANGDWFFNKPKLTEWFVSDFILKPFNKSEGTSSSINKPANSPLNKPEKEEVSNKDNIYDPNKDYCKEDKKANKGDNPYLGKWTAKYWTSPKGVPHSLTFKEDGTGEFYVPAYDSSCPQGGKNIYFNYTITDKKIALKYTGSDPGCWEVSLQTLEVNYDESNKRIRLPDGNMIYSFYREEK